VFLAAAEVEAWRVVEHHPVLLLPELVDAAERTLGRSRALDGLREMHHALRGTTTAFAPYHRLLVAALARERRGFAARQPRARARGARRGAPRIRRSADERIEHALRAELAAMIRVPAARPAAALAPEPVARTAPTRRRCFLDDGELPGLNRASRPPDHQPQPPGSDLRDPRRARGRAPWSGSAIRPRRCTAWSTRAGCSRRARRRGRTSSLPRPSCSRATASPTRRCWRSAMAHTRGTARGPDPQAGRAVRAVPGRPRGGPARRQRGPGHRAGAPGRSTGRTCCRSPRRWCAGSAACWPRTGWRSGAGSPRPPRSRMAPPRTADRLFRGLPDPALARVPDRDGGARQRPTWWRPSGSPCCRAPARSNWQAVSRAIARARARPASTRPPASRGSTPSAALRLGLRASPARRRSGVDRAGGRVQPARVGRERRGRVAVFFPSRADRTAQPARELAVGGQPRAGVAVGEAARRRRDEHTRRRPSRAPAIRGRAAAVRDIEQQPVDPDPVEHSPRAARHGPGARGTPAGAAR